MASALPELAGELRAVARHAVAQASPLPERFRVVVVSPLQVEGTVTDVLLSADDDDVEVFPGVAAAPLEVGDLVWVQAEPQPDDEIQWAITLVVDGALPGGGGGGGSGAVQTFTQAAATNPWTIHHGLGRYPVGLETFDSSGVQVEGDVVQTDLNTTTITWSGAMAGSATYL